MKVALIGTYTPRQCGIGTFSKNLFDAVCGAEKVEPVENIVIALNDPEMTYSYPEEVKYTIDQDNHDDYLNAAEFINKSGADICILQHEYGIFGGQNGVFILSLLHQLRIPVVVTLHTVLKRPSYNELVVLKEIGNTAQKIVVMSQIAVSLLTKVYEIPDDKIEMIHHGVPDISYERESVRQELDVVDKKVIFTFGFLGRGKGIEIALRALPDVVKKHPNVLYIILGTTHPNVIKHAGEEYRLFLYRIVKKLGLEDHVLFLNQYATEQDLFKYLTASDIYLTPYPNEAQITSGTLSYAVGVGAAIVSTPYWHATELLAEGRGQLFNFNDNKNLSEVLNDLLDNPEKISNMQKKASELGKQMTWPQIGDNYYATLNYISKHTVKAAVKQDMSINRSILPPFKLDHIERITDSTGIFQHATYGVPNYHEGYCLDDNARALLMALMAYRRTKSEQSLRLIPIYLSYILYAQNPDGTFKNFMSYERKFLDDVGSEDSFGRAIWAIGYALAHSPKDAYYQVAYQIFFKSFQQFEKVQSIRCIANVILGIYHYLKENPTDEGMIALTKKLAYRLLDEYDKYRTDDWHWYESLLAYDNALLPLSMLRAAELLNDQRVKRVAFESMAFLEKHTMKQGYLSLIGNEGWFKSSDKRPAQYAQQPVDAMATVLMYLQAYNSTADQHYLNMLYTSFMWFLGENDMRLSLYDFETHGCCDGLERQGVNRNQGSESTLAYVISYLAIQHTFETPYSELIHEDSSTGSNSLADATP